jgi:hypothetical protein
MRRATVAIAALCVTSPLAAQDEPIKQRTIEDAHRFFSKLGGQGAVVQFLVGNWKGEVDVTGIAPGSSCVTVISVNPTSVRWVGSPPKQRIAIPTSIDLEWTTQPNVEGAGLPRIATSGHYAGSAWGIRFANGWTPAYNYLLFDVAQSFSGRMVEAAEFLREKCQLQSDTGF